MIGGAALRLGGEIELVLLRPHGLIEVIVADFIHQRLGVGEEEQDDLALFLLHHLLMEPNELSYKGSQ